MIHLSEWNQIIRRMQDEIPPSAPLRPPRELQIWPLYLEWAKGFDVRETAVRVFRCGQGLEVT